MKTKVGKAASCGTFGEGLYIMNNYIKPNKLIKFGVEKTIFLLLFYFLQFMPCIFDLILLF